MWPKIENLSIIGICMFIKSMALGEIKWEQKEEEKGVEAWGQSTPILKDWKKEEGLEKEIRTATDLGGQQRDCDALGAKRYQHLEKQGLCHFWILHLRHHLELLCLYFGLSHFLDCPYPVSQQALDVTDQEWPCNCSKLIPPDNLQRNLLMNKSHIYQLKTNWFVVFNPQTHKKQQDNCTVVIFWDHCIHWIFFLFMGK